MLASSILFGCTPSVTPDPISIVENEGELQQTLLTSTPTNPPPFTPTTDLPIDEEPSLTPEPEPTETPTPTPTITPTLQPLFSDLGQAPIEASSLGQLELLDTLGYGHINQLEFHYDAGVFILQTVQGVFLYDGESLDRISYFEDYENIHQVPGKTQMVAVTPERTIELIDLMTGQVIQTMVPENPNRYGSIAFSQDGEMMAIVVIQDHEIRLNWEQSRIDIWDLNQNKPVAKLISDLYACYSMAFSEDHQWLISGCSPSAGGISRVVMWDIFEQKVSWAISSAGGFTNSPFSKDGSLFATYEVNDPTTGSSRIMIRTSLNGSEIGRVYGKLSQNPFSYDNQHIITTSFGQVSVWHTTDFQRVKAFDTGVPWPSASYSEDGRYILVNGGEQAWDAKDFVLVEDYPYEELIIPTVSMSQWRQLGHLSGIRGVEMLNDQEMFVWGFSENEYIWWWYPDRNIYNEVSVGIGKGQPVFSQEKNKFAICTDEGLKLFSIDQSTFETYGGCRMDENYLTFSKDGEVLFRSSGILVDVISVESGEILQQLRAHELNVGNLQISEDGKYLITSNATIVRDGCETILWELDPVRFIRKWRISIAPTALTCLISGKFDHKGNNMVTVLDRISVWRISDGWYMKYFDGTAAAFSFDDSLLAVGTSTSQINFYETDRWELIDTIGMVTDQQIVAPFYYFDDSNSVKDVRFCNQGHLLISILSEDLIQLWGLP